MSGAAVASVPTYEKLPALFRGRLVRPSPLLMFKRLYLLLLLGVAPVARAQPAGPPELARVGAPLAERGTLRVLAGSGDNFPYSYPVPSHSERARGSDYLWEGRIRLAR